MSASIISLFCGAGGLDIGFSQAGFETIAAYDLNVAAVNTMNLNSEKPVAHRRNLMRMHPKEILDLLVERGLSESVVGLVGGPPCQGFSRGNVRAHRYDPRNRLPLRYAAILKYLAAHASIHFFVFENVPGLLRPQHSSRLELIKQRFYSAGFTVFDSSINAVDYGVPQNRPRYFLVGFNRQLYGNRVFEFPNVALARKTVKDAISNFPEPSFCSRLGPNVPNAFHPNHWTMRPKSKRFIEKDFAASSRSFKLLRWRDISPTVAYGNREVHIHPSKCRRLSVYEAMLLQGFPQEYVLTGNFSEQITQISNAVSPPVAKAIAIQIEKMLCVQAPVQRTVA